MARARRARSRPLAPSLLLLVVASFASTQLARASPAVFAVDEPALLNGAALATSDDNAADQVQAALDAAGVVAPPTDAVDEVATWFTQDTVARLRAAVVRVAPVGRGLLVDDAVNGVASVATGVLVGGNTTQPLVLTTWRAVNQGFANYSLTFADGTTGTAKLARYDLGRPLAVLAVDGGPLRFTGVEINGGLEGLQVGDPTLAVGLSPELAAGGGTPPDAWTEYVGYAYDLRAPLPLVTGAASPLRNIRCVVSRALLTRPQLGASAGVFDASGRLIGLDIMSDLAAAGAGARRPEVHTVPGPYLADAVAEARELLADATLHRGDLGVSLTLIPTGAAVQYYGLPRVVAVASTPDAATTENGGGTAPKVIKVVGVDVDAPAAGLILPGDIILSVDGGGLLEDDLLAYDRAVTDALVGATRIAVVTLVRDGVTKDVAVPVADLETMHTRRVMTWAGCTFQEAAVAVRRRYQQVIEMKKRRGGCDTSAQA